MKFYVYIHRRPDTNAIFYVGRGQIYNDRSTYPRRAHSEHKRNEIWKRIVKKNNGIFLVEIDYWYFVLEEALEKEIELIKFYGKIIDKTGTLSNITDGGDGAIGLKHTEITIAKMKASHAANPKRSDHFRTEEFRKNHSFFVTGNQFAKGFRHSDAAKAEMSKNRKGTKHPEAKVVINCWSGEKFGCVEDAAKSIGLNKWTLYKSLSGERQNRTVMRYANGM